MSGHSFSNGPELTRHFHRFVIDEREGQYLLSAGLLEAIYAGFYVRYKGWKTLRRLERRSSIQGHLFNKNRES